MSAKEKVKRIKVSKIELCDFQAFPGPYATTIDLIQDGRGKGLSLLLYGENGSGKSSIGRALRDMLSSVSRDITAFDKSRHIYSDPPSAERSVILHFDDPAQPQMVWKPDTRDHTGHPLFAAMAQSRGWMDYRTLWNALQFIRHQNFANVFDALCDTLLTDCEMPASSRTFGELWESIKTDAGHNPTTVYYTRDTLRRLKGNILEFTAKLRVFLPLLGERTNLLLKQFIPWTEVTLSLERPPVYDSRSRYHKFSRGTVSLRATFREQPLPFLDGFLNEARITAIAMALFLAALTLSTPPKLADGTYYPRLLVLDDVLISLDMAHRRPLIEVLNEHFSGWQVFLLTHDRAWYEMAKTQLAPGKWKFTELFAVPFGDYEQPLVKGDVPHLEKARQFLADGEVKAAAVHVRTQFELVLKEACRELHLRVPYVDDPRRWDASHFWDSLKGHWKDRADLTQLKADMDHSLSWVLNPHSHSRPVDHIRQEIHKAVKAVADLDHQVKTEIYDKKNAVALKATAAAAEAASAIPPP